MISSKLKHRKSGNHCFIVIWKNLRETVSKRIAIFIHPCHAPLLFHTTTLYTYIYIVSQWLHPSPPPPPPPFFHSSPAHSITFSLAFTSFSLYAYLLSCIPLFPLTLTIHYPLFPFLASTTFIFCILHPEQRT